MKSLESSLAKSDQKTTTMQVKFGETKSKNEKNDKKMDITCIMKSIVIKVNKDHPKSNLANQHSRREHHHQHPGESTIELEAL